MRWLLLKDLRILRRSPLLVALLALYPVVVAGLIGAALAGGPEKPRVAFANLAGDAEFSLGGQELDPTAYTSRLFESIEPIRVETRAEAIEKVRDGEALAALVIPADAADRLRGMLSLGGGEAPTVEVFYNAEDPVKRRYVESTIRSRLAEADAALSDAVLAQSARYLDLVVKGGELSFPLVGEVKILGLRNARTLIDTLAARSARGCAGAGRARAGQPLREARGGQSRPLEADPGLDRRAGEGEADRGDRLAHAARRVRRHRRGDGLADVRHAAARLRPAGAGARGERLRPARARAWSRAARCWRRRSCSPPPRRWRSRCCSWSG